MSRTKPMNPRHAARTRSRFVALTAALLAAALSFGVMTPKHAYAAELNDVPERIAVDASARVPVVESSIGRGGLAAEGGTVALPGVDGYDAALIRIGVFDAAQDVTVNVAGAPALAVAAGHDASQTVLAPIVDGGVSMSATADVDSRVEVLALFDGDENVPGSTNAVAEPVLRADTAQGLAGGSLGTEPLTVGLTGQGGVPSTGVRAVYVTLTFDAAEAGAVTLGGQRIDVPAGRSVISTIVVPDGETQDIEVAADRELGSFALAVRGWVRGSVQNDAAANVEGSFVPTVGAEWIETDVSASNGADVTLDGVADRAFSLVLVDASSHGAASDAGARHTFIDVGDGIKGRSQGVLVDDELGAPAQIDVVDTASANATVDVRGADATAGVLALGAIVGERPADPGTVEVTIDTPSDGDGIDLAETGGAVTLEGTVDSDVAVDKVEVYADGESIGTAELTSDGQTVRWSFETAAPMSDTYEFEVKATTRGGAEGADSVTLPVRLPEADDIVVASQAVAIDPDAEAGAVTAIVDDDVYFSAKPQFNVGDVIVSGVGAAVPHGFLNRVKSIDRVGDQWVVRCEQGVLTDVFIQAEVRYTESVINDDTVLHVSESESENSETLPGDVSNVQILPADQMDMDVRGNEQAALAKTGQRGDLLAEEAGVEFHFDYSFEPGKDKAQDHSKQEDSEQKAEDAAEINGGISLSFDASVKIGANMVLDINPILEWGGPEGVVELFEASVYGELKADTKAVAFAEFSQKVTRDEFMVVNTPDITVPIGMMPLVLTTEVPFDFEAGVDASAKLQYENVWKQTFEKGMRYTSSDGWELIDEQTSEKADRDPCWPTGLSVEGSLVADAGITAKPEMMLYDTVGPSLILSAVGRFTLDASISANGLFKVSGKLELLLSLGGNVSMQVPIIDAGILEHDFGTVEFDPIVLLQWDPEPISLSCAAGDDSVTHYHGVVYDQYRYSTGNGEIVPLSGATVTLQNDDGEPFAMTTGADGAYAFDLPTDDYDVTVTKPGYVAQTGSLDILDSEWDCGLWLEPGEIHHYTVDVTYGAGTGLPRGQLFLTGYYEPGDTWTAVLGGAVDHESTESGGYASTYDNEYIVDDDHGVMSADFYLGDIGEAAFVLRNVEDGQHISVTVRRDGETIYSSGLPGGVAEGGEWWTLAIDDGVVEHDRVPDWVHGDGDDTGGAEEGGGIR
ncbi:carboxypeptidase regulatory-like domain-containing protein [Bifidobacterium phasiani]|uniref:Carboxypeptidase regulatory-like domain-containing protein n=1 Tax=Bifidobacterium phasiani TaxID=2834431 RepID=A0ABS6W8M2_9BIFI|nr:carboxypeptidase regulatory-like domain-containing protein [Bifidobacterium phasiani]MBW3082082.1 carboxypeptidase regulatory-like domain-containing protein [Bifidobacterium phasiani]